MIRRSEYVVYFCSDVSDEALDSADVDGGYNKRQADKLIKQALNGERARNGAYVNMIYHYTNWGDCQELYWIHPTIEGEKE